MKNTTKEKQVIEPTTKTITISTTLFNNLVLLGIIPFDADSEQVRSHNVGESNYSDYVIQPYAVWLDWSLNAWDADIVKRICRQKSTESQTIKYNKIIHICQERLRQLNAANKIITATVNGIKPYLKSKKNK